MGGIKFARGFTEPETVHFSGELTPCQLLGAPQRARVLPAQTCTVSHIHAGAGHKDAKAQDTFECTGAVGQDMELVSPGKKEKRGGNVRGINAWSLRGRLMQRGLHNCPRSQTRARGWLGMAVR